MKANTHEQFQRDAPDLIHTSHGDYVATKMRAKPADQNKDGRHGLKIVKVTRFDTQPASALMIVV